MTLYLSEYLTQQHIDSVKANFGYTNSGIIEKFIMDFEMQYQISKKLKCITRGGLCVPFHLNDHQARRLSEDIDLVTDLPLAETESVMNNLADEIDEIRLEKHIPKNPKPLPLVTYRAFYTSCYGSEGSIKIDILCDTNIRSPEFKIIPAGFQMFAFNTPGTVSVLDHGSLIGDKLSTLSLSTPIGLDPHDDENGIMKQLYDIGTLLKLVTKDTVLQAYDTFSSYTNLKIERFQSNLSVNDIVSNIDVSLAGLLETSKQLLLGEKHSIRFDSFKGNYLGKIPYTTPRHITDILLIRMFNKSMSSIQNGVSSNDAAVKFVSQVQQVNNFQSMTEGADIAQIKDELLDTIPTTIPKKVLRGASPEAIFLIRELLN